MKCKLCGAKVVKLPTHGGTVIQVNAETVPEGAKVFDLVKMQAHYAVCPKEDHASRKRKGLKITGY